MDVGAGSDVLGSWRNENAIIEDLSGPFQLRALLTIKVNRTLHLDPLMQLLLQLHEGLLRACCKEITQDALDGHGAAAFLVSPSSLRCPAAHSTKHWPAILRPPST